MSPLREMLLPLVLVVSLGGCAAAPPEPANDGGYVEAKTAEKGERQKGRVGERVEGRVDQETDEAVDSVLDRFLNAIFN